VVPLIVLACLAAVALLAFSTGRNVLHNYQLRQDEQALRNDLRQLEREQNVLTSIRDYLESDQYVEDIARRVLGLVFPGETLVIVAGTEAQPAQQPAPDRTPGADWWRSLFNVAEPTPVPRPPLAP
jgi:cell division protein FtsB